MDSDSVRLVDYKRSDRRPRRRRRGDRGQGDSLELVSDSELSRREGGRLEDTTTVFSDTCDENLPSSRAKLAASRRHHQSLGFSHNKESTPLLEDKNGKAMEADTSMVVKMDEYEIAAPPPIKKRNSNKWLRLRQW